MVLDQKKKQNVIDYFQAKNGYKREDSRLKIGKKLAAEERKKKDHYCIITLCPIGRNVSCIFFL